MFIKRETSFTIEYHLLQYFQRFLFFLKNENREYEDPINVLNVDNLYESKNIEKELSNQTHANENDNISVILKKFQIYF